MVYNFKKIIFYVILVFLLVGYSFADFSNQTLIFSEGGTEVVTLTFQDEISSFSFELEGLEESSSYPSEVSVDFGNNELNYDPYVSTNELIIEEINDIYSISSSNNKNFQSNMGIDDIGNSFGELYDGKFVKSSSQEQRSLGVMSIEDISEQVIFIEDSSSIFPVFLPRVSNLLGTASFYVTEGGSTYYCYSNHSFYLSKGCDMSPSQALDSNHLAASGQDDFSTSHKINSQLIVDSINEQLSTCSQSSCDVDIEISSATAGKIELRDISVTYASSNQPAEITLNENSNDFDVSINEFNALSEVSYFYGDMPEIIISPVIASDDSVNLGLKQIRLLEELEENLSKSWDDMTENKFPLDFKLSLDLTHLENYEIADTDFSKFKSESREIILDKVSQSNTPKIVIILDVQDYFPGKSPSNSISSYSEENSVIGSIYMNGFSNDVSAVELENYESEVFINLLLHELAHTFIQYDGNPDFFYGGHPQSYSSFSSIPTESVSNSPITSESYYEIYSILNQVRPYLQNSQLESGPKISQLDQMIMGIRNIYEDSTYKLYSANVEESSTSFEISDISLEEEVDAKQFYESARNLEWWNIFETSQINSQGVDTSFSIPKSEQDSRALWVIANDDYFTNNFEVFSNNAESKVTILSELETGLFIYDIKPNEDLTFETDEVLIEIKTSLESVCYLSENDVDIDEMEFNFSSDDNLNHEFLWSELEGGLSYDFYVVCEDLAGVEDNERKNIYFSVKDEIDEDDSRDDSTDSGGSEVGGVSDRVTDRDESRNEEISNDSEDVGETSSPGVCRSNFEYSSWSSCEGDEQQRRVVDLNRCETPFIQTRTCGDENEESRIDEKEVQDFSLEQREDNEYSTSFGGSYNSVIASDVRVEGENFTIYDESTGERYLGSLIDEGDDKFYYSVEPLEEEVQGSSLIYLEQETSDILYISILVLLFLSLLVVIYFNFF